MKHYAILGVVSLGLLLAGCSSARDVEVTGEVSGAAQGQILLEFFDVNGDEKVSAGTTVLGADRTFTQKVSLEGDKVLVRAIADTNDDEACSEGEQWAEATAEIEDDKAGPIELALVVAACPKD